MSTLEIIKTHGEEIIFKIKSGGIPTKEEQKVLKIYNGLYAKKAGNAGKRNASKTQQVS